MKRKIALSLAFLAAAPLARAAGSKEAGLMLGQAIILGTQADQMTDAMTFSLFYFKRFDRWLSGGCELGQSFGHTMKGTLTGKAAIDADVPPDGVPDTLDFASSVKRKILWLTPLLRIGLADEDSNANFRPYFILGGGLYDVQNKSGPGTLSGRTSAGAVANGRSYTVPTFKSDSFGTNFGIGSTARLGNSFELAGDVRYHYILADNSTTIQFIYPSARFTFFFGEP